jgi:hypothetical protein
MADEHEHDIGMYQVVTDTCGKVLALESIANRQAESRDGGITIRGDEETNHTRFVENSGYIKGYLSALNVVSHRHGGRGDLFGTTDIYADVWPWLLDYCRRNPNDGFYGALNQYAITVTGNRP